MKERENGSIRDSASFSMFVVFFDGLQGWQGQSEGQDPGIQPRERRSALR